jgi:CPA2 family monovalent cation:H+ antiporter-2
MHNLDLILTLTGGLSAALVAGYLTHRAGLSPIVGYLLAGVVIGPYTPGFVADQPLAEQMAEVGVILLMFGVGLQFHVDELLAVGRIAVPGAVAQSLVATLLGAGVAHLAGWSWNGGLVFGIALSVASTVVLVRVLSDHHALHTPAGHIAVGWLVVEDVFTVVVLVLMPALLGSHAAGGGAVIAVLLALAKMGVAVLFTIYVGGRAIPWLLRQLAATRSRELFTLAVLAVALGIAVGSALLFDVSMALGAFLAGLVVGRSDFAVRAATDALPMRDAFAVLFFVSVGMLLDPAALVQRPGLFMLTLGIVVLAKPLVAWAITAAFRYPLAVSLPVAIALAQIGEFSFIVARLGGELGVLDAAAMNLIVAAAIASIMINPLLYRSIAGVLARRDRQRFDAARRADPGTDDAGAPPVAIVIGAGPVGDAVVQRLQERGVTPTVIELNMDTIDALRAQGVRTIYGDASHPDTLIAAGLRHARALVITTPDIPAVAEVIRLARDLNPGIRIFARSHYLREETALRRAGADEALSGERAVAEALADRAIGERA